jgi:hypothetical protein
MLLLQLIPTQYTYLYFSSAAVRSLIILIRLRLLVKILMRLRLWLGSYYTVKYANILETNIS